MTEPLTRGGGATRGYAVLGACKGQAPYSLQMLNMAKRAVSVPIPDGGRAWHEGGTMGSGNSGKSSIVDGMA